jgi:hypothetical protein
MALFAFVRIFDDTKRLDFALFSVALAKFETFQ